MKIFLDVGGHRGETLREVLKPMYYFDVIHCFEPQRACYQLLKEKFAHHLGGKLALHNYGLADFDGERDLFGGTTSSIGASLFADKVDIDNREHELCHFVSVSDFVERHIGEDDFALMKLNCEGGELLILRDLVRSGNFRLLENVYIDFDIRKVPSLQAEEAKILQEMRDCGFDNYMLRDDLGRVKTYSFSRKKMVARGMGVYPVRLWMVSLMWAGGSKFRRPLSLGERMMMCMPRWFWGRVLRVRKNVLKAWMKRRNRRSTP